MEQGGCGDLCQNCSKPRLHHLQCKLQSQIARNYQISDLTSGLRNDVGSGGPIPGSVLGVGDTLLGFLHGDRSRVPSGRLGLITPALGSRESC